MVLLYPNGPTIRYLVSNSEESGRTVRYSILKDRATLKGLKGHMQLCGYTGSDYMISFQWFRVFFWCMCMCLCMCVCALLH